MRRLLRWMVGVLAVLLASFVLGILAFDLMTVRPVVSRIEDQLSAAATSERLPSAAVMDMLGRAYGGRINNLVADRALWTEGTRPPPNLPTRVGVALLLSVHLSEAKIASAYLSTAYMGPGIYGFAAASQHYLGIPLDLVNLEQAAKLVAIAHAPRFYSLVPERLERRTRYLLSLPGRAN